MEKYLKRLLSKKMERNFNVMFELFAKDLSKSDKKKFADLLQKQLNGAYRVGQLDK